MQGSRVTFAYHTGDLPWDARVSPNDCETIAHCVSADVCDARWGSKGVARSILDVFGIRNEVKARVNRWSRSGKLLVGSVVVVAGNWRVEDRQQRAVIVNLITKERYGGKPTYASLESAFTGLHTYMTATGCNKMGIPLLACGRDAQLWSMRPGHPQGNGGGQSGVVCVQALLEATLMGVTCDFHVFHRLGSQRGRDTCERVPNPLECFVGEDIQVTLVNGNDSVYLL